MTIAATADRIMDHPYFRSAVAAFMDGSRGDLRILLIDLMAHVALQQNALDARAYNLRKRENYPDIYQAIKEKGAGCDLSFKMPVPDEICLVIRFVEECKKEA